MIPCYVQEIITTDPKHEYGIKVKCENGCVGRIKYVGTEASSDSFNSGDLLKELETRLRKIIDREFSKIDPNWSENKSIVGEKLKDEVMNKFKSGKKDRDLLGIPKYEFIQNTNFYHLPQLISGKYWSCFEKIFINKQSLCVKLDELSKIRNPTAHSNILPDMLEKKIQVYYDDIVRLIENYEREYGDQS